jgi:hypothetical protein
MSLLRSRLGPITPIGLANPKPSTLNKVCSNCLKESNNLSACSKCREVDYCSKECQIAHWKAGHKKMCGRHQCTICLDLDPIPTSLACQLGCPHHFHKICVEGIKEWGISDNICPDCRPPIEQSAQQLFEVAVRRLFVLERRCARDDSSWDALAESEETDMNEILRILRDTSAEGHGPSTCALGLLSHLGHGVEKDYEEALRLWQLGAEQVNI